MTQTITFDAALRQIEQLQMLLRQETCKGNRLTVDNDNLHETLRKLRAENDVLRQAIERDAEEIILCRRELECVMDEDGDQWLYSLPIG